MTGAPLIADGVLVWPGQNTAQAYCCSKRLRFSARPVCHVHDTIPYEASLVGLRRLATSSRTAALPASRSMQAYSYATPMTRVASESNAAPSFQSKPGHVPPAIPDGTYAQISARQCAGLVIRPHTTSGCEGFSGGEMFVTLTFE
jgi:hypothetical protein